MELHYLLKSWWKYEELSDGYLKPCQISMMEPFCENSLPLKAVNYFYKNAPSKMLYTVLNGSDEIFKVTENQNE